MSIYYRNYQLLVLLFVLVTAVTLFALISWWESYSRNQLLLKATETDKVEICLRGTQSQRSRNCPVLIRQSAKGLQQLRISCNKNSGIAKKFFFNARAYDCNNIANLKTLKEQLIRAIRL